MPEHRRGADDRGGPQWDGLKLDCTWPSRPPFTPRGRDFATLRATMLSGLIPVRKCFHHFFDLRHPSVERTDGVSDCSQWSGYSLHVRNDPLNFRTEPIELFICRKRSPLLVVHY